MFASDVVIIFIVLIGVCYILFGKKKNIKEDSKFHKTINEYYIYHCCCNRFVSLDTDGIVLPHNVFNYYMLFHLK